MNHDARGSGRDALDIGIEMDLATVLFEHLPQRLTDIRILAVGFLDDGDVRSETLKGLRQSNVASPKQDQMLWQLVQCRPIFGGNETDVSQTGYWRPRRAIAGIEYYASCPHHSFARADEEATVHTGKPRMLSYEPEAGRAYHLRDCGRVLRRPPLRAAARAP